MRTPAHFADSATEKKIVAARAGADSSLQHAFRNCHQAVETRRLLFRVTSVTVNEIKPAYHGSWAESARVIPARLNAEG